MGFTKGMLSTASRKKTTSTAIIIATSGLQNLADFSLSRHCNSCSWPQAVAFPPHICEDYYIDAALCFHVSLYKPGRGVSCLLLGADKLVMLEALSPRSHVKDTRYYGLTIPSLAIVLIRQLCLSARFTECQLLFSRGINALSLLLFLKHWVCCTGPFTTLHLCPQPAGAITTDNYRQGTMVPASCHGAV